MKHSLRLYALYGLLFSVAMLCMAGRAVAGADARLQVQVPAVQGDESGQSDLTGLVKQALPMLWDRLVPQSQRARANALPASVGLSSRIVPGDSGAMVVFNPQTVFQTLHDAGIDYLATSPQFDLVIHVSSSAGTPMPQTEALLMQYAQSIAPRWGIELAAAAPTLVLSWSWVDDTQVMLTVRGNSRLPEFSDTRTLPTGSDPLPSLQDWLQQVLLKARDAYVETAVPTVPAATTATNGGKMVWITVVDHAMSLSEQVTLEDALRHDPRVKALIPYSYSQKQIVYHLQLATENGNWLSNWFSKRGFQPEATGDGGGWLVH